MAHPQSKRMALRSAYIFKGMTLEEAADSVGVSIGTARRWKSDALRAEDDDWEKVRAAACLANAGMEDVTKQLLTQYVIRHKSLMESVDADDSLSASEKIEALSKLADSFSKVVACSRRVLPETDRLATALDVIGMLAEFTRQRFPQYAPAILEIVEPFGAYVAKELG
mgnify:CR=1 FL=1|jgi:hypothetical protein|nr:MAG TPA: Protein of unknown function (DUF1804) [Caudoviricetes sp.]